MFLDVKIVIVFCLVLTVSTLFSQCPDGYVSTGTERAINGTFEAGNTGFTSAYTYVANGPGQLELHPEGYYSVWNNPNDLHAAFAINTDSLNTGKMMIINGSKTANTNVWKQIITVNPNTIYYFVTDVASVNPSSPAQLQFKVNGVLLGSVFNATSTNLEWKTFYATWNSGSITSDTISIVNQNIATSGNDFALDNISFIPCNQILPIELVDFKVEQSNCKEVIVKWQTSSEKNNDFFTIERSVDGQNFEVLSTITSKNSNSTTLQKYSFIDKNPEIGIAYYRLKQTDVDGAFKYSHIVSMRSCNEDTFFDVTVYPNPSIGKINVSFDGDQKDIESFCIFNVFGQKLYESSSFQPQLDIENCNAGMYILRIVLQSNKTVEKRFCVK